jgi:hypothetical protein
MSRYIDADKLHYKAVYIADGYDAKRAVVVFAKEIDKAEHINDWIPCSERLPESMKTIWITDEHNNTYLGHYNSYYCRFYDDILEIETTAVAWSLLPDPYNPESANT